MGTRVWKADIYNMRNKLQHTVFWLNMDAMDIKEM